VELRPVEEQDLPLIHRLTSDPDATGDYEWYGWRDPHEFRRRWDEDGLLGDELAILIVCRGADRLGFVAWRKVPTGRISHCWSMGIALAPEARGQGYGTAAQRLLVRYLFRHSQVNRIEATTEIGNLAEQHALEKAGFTREGLLRGHGFQNGRWHDGVLYSVLRDEVDLHGGA
jgi:RimJ/RimL family protein N-acetyltransferase